MKTFCFSLLVLLTVCCCKAMLEGPRFLASPVKCCTKFSTSPVPRDLVTDIYQTSCANKAFIVETVKGREICFSQSFNWAAKLFNRLNNSEASG